MKILQVVASTDPKLGGVIEGVRLTGDVLGQMGHQMEVVSADDPASPWLPSFSFPVHALGPGKSIYGYAPKLVPWLRENASRYDAVLGNGMWEYACFAVWKALHGTQTPYFIYTHGMLDPWFKKTYPLKHLKKCLYWPWAGYRMLRDAKGVLFMCEEEKLLARQSFSLYRAREVVVSQGTAGPIGDAEAQRAAFQARFPELAGKRLLLFLSRIHIKKGCDLLIEAFAQVASQDASLHLVMAGPDQTGWRSELESRAAALGIADRITWPGMLSGDLKWGAFFNAEAFVLPSHQENFGIAVAEALACGIPVLISNKVNIWREIAEDNAGLVADDTVSGIVQLLQGWEALSPSARMEMGRRARLCFEKRFEIGIAAQNLLKAIAP